MPPTNRTSRCVTGFKALDYRLMTSEPFMIHRLRRIPRVAAPVTIRRVRTPELAARLAKAARSRQILPENLGDEAPQRQYVALIDGAIVGWVGSIAMEDATWCQNMFVQREFRRRGIARAMLCRLLRDDRTARARSWPCCSPRTPAPNCTPPSATARSAPCCCSRRASARHPRPERRCYLGPYPARQRHLIRRSWIAGPRFPSDLVLLVHGTVGER